MSPPPPSQSNFDQRLFHRIENDINNLSNFDINFLSNMSPPPSQSVFDPVFDSDYDINNSDLFDSDLDMILPNMSPMLDFGISISEEYNTGDYVNDAEFQTLLQNFPAQGGTHGAPPASNSSLENLENFVIDKNNDDNECTICQEIVNVGQVVMKLPCKHVYHDHCITTWLNMRNSCPVCRFELPTDDKEYENRKRIAAFGEYSL